LAAFSACAGLALALHHPLSGGVAGLVFVLVAGLAWRYGTQTPWLLAWLPVLGLAPWTGWITFEELDLLVLACAAGGYAAIAFRPSEAELVASWRRPLAYSPMVLLSMALFAASVLLSLQRGFADAGGFAFGWYQGYHEAMNSVRLGKCYFLALLLLPLWIRAAATRPQQFGNALLYGLAGALALASLAAVWERAAFPGLMDFSSDYRTTALFWEMHVGGAALDGCLAITLPFAFLLLTRAHRPLSFGLAMALLLLASYACLTTFSRGVYLAVPVSFGVFAALTMAQRRRMYQGREALPTADLGYARLGGLLIMLTFTLSAVAMFIAGGYRAMLALVGAIAVLVLMPASLWLPARSQRVAGLLLGALMAAPLAALCWLVASAVPKAAYFLYALVFLLAIFLRWRDRPGQVRVFYAAAVAGVWFLLLSCAAIVADHWSEGHHSGLAAQAMAAPALLWALMLIWPKLWPFKPAAGFAAWRVRGAVVGVAVLLAATIATLMAGAYMRDRSAASSGDMALRIEHWRQGVSMLKSPGDWWFGKGSGRFVANHFFIGPASQHTGDYRIKTEEGRNFLVLTGGKHVQGRGEMFRVSQRMAPPRGAVTLTAQVRAQQDVGLHAEICEKHLLYSETCVVKQVRVMAKAGVWQTVEFNLGTAPAMGGAWLAPRLIAFSVAVDSAGAVAEIAELRLMDERQQALLLNADFSDEMAHWFFSSDRHHMPWHIKQMALHVLFDQGLLGVGLLGVMTVLGLSRLSFGRGREHELAPALAAALVGFLVVGLFDSLLDVPRMAFLFYLLLLLSLGLRALPASDNPAASEAPPKAG
jgi:hypothetical protein